jgi:hypothetical protein
MISRSTFRSRRAWLNYTCPMNSIKEVTKAKRVSSISFQTSLCIQQWQNNCHQVWFQIQPDCHLMLLSQRIQAFYKYKEWYFKGHQHFQAKIEQQHSQMEIHIVRWAASDCHSSLCLLILLLQEWWWKSFLQWGSQEEGWWSCKENWTSRWGWAWDYCGWTERKFGSQSMAM